MTETFDGVYKEIAKTFEKADNDEDIVLIHQSIWPAVVKWEKFFRKSGDIRALQHQIELLCMMGDNIYRGNYLTDAYVVCRRILDINPNDEAAKNTIKDHILPYFYTDAEMFEDDPKIFEEYKKRNESIEPNLDEYFMNCKKDEFVLFLDDNANSFNPQGNDVGER